LEKNSQKNYGLEIALFHHLRQFTDGLTFFNVNINWDRYLSDHTPRFMCHIIACNYTLVEINIYIICIITMIAMYDKAVFKNSFRKEMTSFNKEYLYVSVCSNAEQQLNRFKC